MAPTGDFHRRGVDREQGAVVSEEHAAVGAVNPPLNHSGATHEGLNASVIAEWTASVGINDPTLGQEVREGFRLPLVDGAEEKMTQWLVHSEDEASRSHQQRALRGEANVAHATTTLTALQQSGGIVKPRPHDWQQGVLLGQLHAPSKDGLLSRTDTSEGEQSAKPRLCADGTGRLAEVEDVRRWSSTSIALDELANVVQKHGGWMASADWANGYQQLRIHPDHQRLVAFVWPASLGGDDGVWLYTVMTYGPRSSAGLFARVVRALTAKTAAELGTGWIGSHVDDMVLVQESKAAATHALATLNRLATEGGIKLSPKKEMEPTQNAHVLGAVIDTVAKTVGLSKEKRDKYTRRIERVVEHARRMGSAPRHAIEVVAGCVQYVAALLAPLKGTAPCLLHALAEPAADMAVVMGQRRVHQAAYRPVTVTPYGLELMRTALTAIKHWSGATPFHHMWIMADAASRVAMPSGVTLAAATTEHWRTESRTNGWTAWEQAATVILSDASETGGGITWRWHRAEAAEHAAVRLAMPASAPSAARELEAGARALQLINVDLLRLDDTTTLVWVVDADAAVKALRRTYSTASTHMQVALRAVLRERRALEIRLGREVRLVPVWRPRDWLEQQDALSRVSMPDEEPGAIHWLHVADGDQRVKHAAPLWTQTELEASPGEAGHAAAIEAARQV